MYTKKYSCFEMASTNNQSCQSQMPSFPCFYRLSSFEIRIILISFPIVIYFAVGT